MLYHVSKTPGLKVLKPQASTHGVPYVYAVENLVTGLLFGAKHDDFYFFIATENGVPLLMECYPGALREVYEGKSCAVYEIAETGFQRGKTTWSAELVSELETPILREISVPNLYARLLEEEQKGRLIVRRYEDTVAYKHLVSEHIADRLIRFDMVYSENERLRTHYGRLMDALQEVMSGKLL